MSKLPFELYKPIIDELDSRSDFIALARTSKAFWSEVISKLYDAVTLGDEITTTLFLSTHRANPTLVQLVRDLTVRTTWSQFFDHTIELVECINDMACLKQLSIDYPKANSFIPRLFNGPLWTRKLHLPNIHSLRLHFDPFISPFTLFGTLPRPLPKLTTLRTVTLEALTDVTTVYCFGTYQYHGLKHLVHLRHLKSCQRSNASSEFMPNLESLIFGGSMMRTSLEGATHVSSFKASLRMIGPIAFRRKGEVDKIHLNASHMTNLQIVLLRIRISPQLRNDLIISRFARACPLLEHAIVFAEDKDSRRINALVHYKKNPAKSWVLDHIIKDRHVLENWSDWVLDLLRGLGLGDEEEPAPL